MSLGSFLSVKKKNRKTWVMNATHLNVLCLNVLQKEGSEGRCAAIKCAANTCNHTCAANRCTGNKFPTGGKMSEEECYVMLCKNLVHRLFGWRTNSYHSGQLNRGLDSYSQNNKSKPKSVKPVHIWPILWGEPHSHSARWFEPPMKVSMLTEKSGDL